VKGHQPVSQVNPLATPPGVEEEGRSCPDEDPDHDERQDRLAEYGETDPLRRRHAEYFCRLEAWLAERLWGCEEVDAYRQFAAERENVLTAVNYAVDTIDIDLALRLVRHSPRPAGQIGFALILPFPVILDLPDAASHDLYPYALASSATAAATRGELEHIERDCQEALQASRRLSSQHERLWVEYLIAVARGSRLMALGQWRESAGYGEQAAAIAREYGRESLVAIGLTAAASGYTMAGDPQAGVDIAKKALEMSRAAGAPAIITTCLVTLAGALAGSDPPAARRLLEEALALQESLDMENVSLVTQATLIAAGMGDWPLTLQLANRSIRHLQWGGQRPYLVGILNVVARALAETDVEAAAVLQGAARHLAPQPAAGQTTVPRRPDPVSPAVAPAGSSLITDLRRQTSALLHEGLDEGQVRQLRAEGEAMDGDQAAAYALEAIRRARQSI
jgi:hypothetical protein